MGKTFLYLVMITVLLFLTVGTVAVIRLIKRSSSPTLRQTNHSVSVSALLQAHGGGSDRDWSRFLQKGTLNYPGSQQLERQLSLATNGSITRYDRVTLDANQSFLFDGNTVVSITSQPGAKSDGKPLEGAEAEIIKSQIGSFGLLPILKKISDPATQVLYLGATSKGDRFEVKTVKGSWYFYSNSNHLIERVEAGELNITYGDYRTVDGLTLPYYQEVRKDDSFLYGFKFETFELNPVFAANFFEY